MATRIHVSDPLTLAVGAQVESATGTPGRIAGFLKGSVKVAWDNGGSNFAPAHHMSLYIWEESAPRDLSKFAMSFPVIRGEIVMQGHADYCAANGHATHTSDGVIAPYCPRCGDTLGTPYVGPGPVAKTQGKEVASGLIAKLDRIESKLSADAIIEQMGKEEFYAELEEEDTVARAAMTRILDKITGESDRETVDKLCREYAYWATQV